MTQPELGKEIARLRKENGLTQEELVERCNINVRTIQRIEAGNVTPRSYTIKSILAAMNLDLDALKDSDSNLQFHITNKPRALQWLLISFCFGALYIATMVCTDLSYFFYETGILTKNTLLTVLLVVELTAILVFYSGFVTLAQITKNSLLAVGAKLIMILGLFWYIAEILCLWFFKDWYLGVLVVEGLFFGVATIVLGLGVWQLRPYIKTMATVTAIAEFVIGALLISVMFQIGAVVLIIPVVCIETTLLYQMRNLVREQ